MIWAKSMSAAPISCRATAEMAARSSPMAAQSTWADCKCASTADNAPADSASASTAPAAIFPAVTAPAASASASTAPAASFSAVTAWAPIFSAVMAPAASSRAVTLPATSADAASDPSFTITPFNSPVSRAAFTPPDAENSRPALSPASRMVQSDCMANPPEKDRVWRVTQVTVSAPRLSVTRRGLPSVSAGSPRHTASIRVSRRPSSASSSPWARAAVCSAP